MPDTASRSLSRSRLMLLVASALAIVLAGCGGSSNDKAEAKAGYGARCGLPDVAERYRVTLPTGTSCIGVTIAFAEDSNRRDLLGPEPARARSVQLRVWYPAADAQGLARAPYSSDLAYAIQRWPDPQARPTGNSLDNAPVAGGVRYPVLLFSPGMGMPVDVYAAMAEDLASHGYIVVGINHPLTSGAVRFPDGRVVFDDPGLRIEDLPKLAELMVADQRFVLDWLQGRQTDRSLPFAGAMDLQRIGAYGHSLGGSAALQTQRTDARVKAAANLDGTVWGDLSTPWSKPWMILHAAGERDPSYALFAANPRPDSILAEVPQAGHLDFSDLPRWMATFKTTLPAAQVPSGADLLHPKPESLEARLRSDLRTFFDKHVK